MATLPVYLERADKRVFAGALDWPGLDRSGKDDAAALEALAGALPRYRRAVERGGVEQAPAEDAQLDVVEEIRGDAGTAFGVPSVGPSADGRPTSDEALARLEALLHVAWAAFDEAVRTAGDRELRKGPRGGGRDVWRMLGHVAEAQAAYVRAIGGRTLDRTADPVQLLARARAEAREALPAIARGQPLQVGSRREAPLWTARYFVRRSAWHSLDHAWEIEDRLET